MKTWLTYLAAAALGLASQVFFKNSLVFYSVFNTMASVMLRLGLFMVFPIVFFAMASGTASLSRKPGANGYVWLSTIFWSIFTSALLSVAAVFLFRLLPVPFPQTSTANSENAATLIEALTSQTAYSLDIANPLTTNAFLNLFKASDCLIPLAALAFIIGWAMRPTTEVIRPAYIVLNSISEAMFRLARGIANFMFIGIFFISGIWFETVYRDRTIFNSIWFVRLLLIIVASVVLVILPLVYAIATGFKRNPYRQICRLLSAATAGFFSNDYLFAQTALYSDCRINLGIQKRVVGTALPLHSIITKGGSAMISSLCTCSLITYVTGQIPDISALVTIALACTITSFLCCLQPGLEVLYCTVMAIGFLQTDIHGCETAVLGLLPVLNGIGVMLDIFLSGLGTSFTACHMDADCHIREMDTV